METPNFLDIMVDVETTGTAPGTNAMIQLSAVRFDLATRSVQPFTEMFDRCLKIPNDRHWDDNTRAWWGKQKRSVLQGIMARGEDPRTVMEDFVKWVGFQNPGQVRFWAKPVTFDWSFVADYVRKYDLMQPFHYRYAMDMNSFIRGLAQDHTLESHYVEFQGDAHNALMDVLNQINQVFDAVDKYGSRPPIPVLTGEVLHAGQ